jgi:hypothetical protein
MDDFIRPEMMNTELGIRQFGAVFSCINVWNMTLLYRSLDAYDLYDINCMKC